MPDFISEFKANEIEEALKILVNMKREEYGKIINCLEKEQGKKIVENIITNSDLINIERKENDIYITIDEEKIKQKFIPKIIKCGIIENKETDTLMEKENIKEDMIFEFNYVWNKQGFIYISMPKILEGKKKIYVNDEEIRFNIKNDKDNIVFISDEMNIKRCIIKIVEV